jgi:putative peptide zinc metalloprotease protein
MNVDAAHAPLPPLREDLCLHASGSDRGGAPTWTIQDPVDNRFFRIGWPEFEMLLRWGGDAQQVAQAVAGQTPLAVDAGQVLAFAAFLARHQLVRPSGEAVRRLAREARAGGWLSARWWLHHYLFFRIPLLRPERGLRALLPLVAPLGSTIGLLLVALAGMTGLLLVAHQWDAFRHAVVDSLDWSGLGGFALALIVAKTSHEMGHALVATRHGVRVSHMGVAFVVLWPMLYTDTGESWKLHDARRRLAISSAGIAVELALAGLATLGWALLPDGALRQSMLYLATTSWVLTLTLNASPFMRFDGYFILSDLLDFPNLHERAGAAARAALRRALFGWDEPDPENFPPTTRRALVAFAFVTWAYRLVVFVGIAVAVYLMFFKALGIVLFGIEISWFVLRPVANELRVWHRRRQETSRPRRFVLVLLALSLVMLACLPWHAGTVASGVAHAQRQQPVYSPFPARLRSLHPAGPVRSGDTLAVFESPDLLARAVVDAAGLATQARRQQDVAVRDDAADQRRVAAQRVVEQLAESQATRDESGRLQLQAEFDGDWRDLDPALRVGTWVGSRQPIGILVASMRWVVDAYVDERTLADMAVGATARFYPDHGGQALEARLVEIDRSRASQLGSALLDARYGGPIATLPGDKPGQPTTAWFRVRLELESPPDVARETRGRVHIDTAARSWAWDLLRSAAAVLVRESGF